jgi:hypothetical protein
LLWFRYACLFWRPLSWPQHPVMARVVGGDDSDSMQLHAPMLTLCCCWCWFGLRVLSGAVNRPTPWTCTWCTGRLTRIPWVRPRFRSLRSWVAHPLIAHSSVRDIDFASASAFSSSCSSSAAALSSSCSSYFGFRACVPAHFASHNTTGSGGRDYAATGEVADEVRERHQSPASMT